MSADLFAAFGDPPPQQQKSSSTGPSRAQPASTFDFFDDPAKAKGPAPQTQPQPQTPQLTTDVNDDWGDFEGGASSGLPPVNQDPFSYPAQSRPLHAQQSQTTWQPAPVYKAKKSYDSNVLFDAEDDAGDEDDEFGDFEGPASSSVPVPPASSTELVDLLGDMAIQQPEPPAAIQREIRKSRIDIPRSPTTKNKTHGFGPISRSNEPAKPLSSATKQEDSWDSFDDWEASIPTKKQGKASTKPKTSPKSRNPGPLPTTLGARYGEPQPGELPPTNVPPPGLLLSLFPQFFAEAHDRLFKPMAAQTLPMRNRLLSEPATAAYLEGYLELASVAARIIAGRKLRWKRDVHLSQGMRIGPASSRATSGMKLTGIDKSENMKEEREVSDMVRAWKKQVGRLRHVVSAANQARAGALGAVPDLQEMMPVRTLKQADGGIPARLPCMLCGLKRDERVGDADVTVVDSFGEWWIDQINMHRGCRNFWREHKDKLRQR